MFDLLSINLGAFGSYGFFAFSFNKGFKKWALIGFCKDERELCVYILFSTIRYKLKK